MERVHKMVVIPEEMYEYLHKSETSLKTVQNKIQEQSDKKKIVNQEGAGDKVYTICTFSDDLTRLYKEL